MTHELISELLLTTKNIDICIFNRNRNYLQARKSLAFYLISPFRLVVVCSNGYYCLLFLTNHLTTTTTTAAIT
jgi:hypothetical protein